MGKLSGSFTADLAVGKICAERDTTEKGAKNETTSGSLVGRHARAAVLLLLVLCWCVCVGARKTPHYTTYNINFYNYFYMCSSNSSLTCVYVQDFLMYYVEALLSLFVCGSRKSIFSCLASGT